MAEDRRTILKVLTHIFGGGAAAIVGVPAIRAVIDPSMKGRAEEGDFVAVANADAVPKDGTPIKAAVVLTDPRDAWVKMPATEVGAVFICKKDGQVTAFSTVCPHLGCGVDYVAAKKAFACPCHESAFGLAGEVTGGPSPRPMDQLETRVVGNRVEVKYVRFVQGTKEKVPV
jgi:Rieske Fe-S protein